MAPFRMGFRTRLALLFLLFAAAPMALLTFFYLRYLTHTIEYWQNPGIARTVENSLALARESLEHYREEARSAGEFLVVLLDPALDAPATSEFLRANAPEVGLDLLALYRGGENGWRRWAWAGDEEAPAELDPEVARAALEGRAPPLDLASPSVSALLPVGEGASGGLLLAGVRPPPELMERIRNLASDADLYRRLAGYERIQAATIVIGTLAVVAFVIAASFVVARMLARSVSSPILRLVEGTRRVSSGDLEHPVEVRATDEIGLLVASFNEMTRDLRVSKENLRQAERVAAWRDVARRIAHEIKNPLTPVELSIHRLRKRMPDIEPQAQPVFSECLGLIEGELGNLRRLADEFSGFARMPQPAPVPSDLEALARSVVDLYGESNPGVRIDLEVQGRPPPVPVDPGQFRQALGNLVKNALEAMPSGGTLAVAIAETRRQSRSGVQVSVTDSGPGLPAELRDRIFDPYVTTKRQGSGLGLAMVQRIVTDHGGSVDVESPVEAAGRGARFRLFFPLLRA